MNRHGRVEAGMVDAYCTTGSSPGALSGTRVISAGNGVARRGAPLTLHLLGPGAVGSALLRMLPPDCVLAGVTDSTATVRGRAGIDPYWIAANKERKRALLVQPGARTLEPEDAIAWIDADIVIDATATDFTRTDRAALLDRAVLARGARLALAAKDALCRAVPRWLHTATRARVGCNAVLGGTGRLLLRELDDLRERCVSVAITGNASTTAIIETLERGGTLSQGIAEAQQRRFLEADPELDLRGADAAVKLAIVAGALRGHAIDPVTISCEDIRTLDADIVRERARNGSTTRLVARADEAGALSVRYEETRRGSPLAAPSGRVVYAYGLVDGTTRVHVGAGVGAVETARALRADIDAFATERCAPTLRAEVTR